MSMFKFFALFFFLFGVKGDWAIPWESDVTQWDITDLEDGLCKTHLQEYIDGIEHFGAGTGEYTWAAQMVDSSAKIPNGIMVYNIVHMGMFDECLAVVHPENHFQGKHCMLSLALPSLPSLTEPKPRLPEKMKIFSKKNNQPQNRQLLSMIFKYGICIPSSCNATDLNKILSNSQKITVIDENCWIKEEKPLSNLAIAFICVCALLTTLTIISTQYHYTYMKEKRRKILCAFSLYENVPKLLEMRKNGDDNMGCLHGIRSLSMMWVVLGHCYEFPPMYGAPIINLNEVPDMVFEYQHAIVTNAFYSVDSFFFLSGLLVAFVFFRKISRNGTYDAFANFIHRYIRLTPPFAMMVFATVAILPELGIGPLWHDIATLEINACNDNWWSTLLYIQNYVKPEAQCIGQSWYLSADMQMFWIAPLILYPIFLWPKLGFAFLVLLTIGSASWTFAIDYIHEYKASLVLMEGQNQFMFEYVTAHTRMAPWLVGILCGTIICGIKARKTTVRISKPLVLLGWCLSTFICLGVLFSIRRFEIGSDVSAVESALYLSLSRLGWGIGLAWIVFACIYGYGGFVNTFLSLAIWQPIGKLSYSVYLIHATILIFKLGTIRTQINMTDAYAVNEFFATLSMSYLFAFLLYVMVEAPFGILDQEILESIKILQYPKSKTVKKQPDCIENGEKQI